MVSKKGSWQSDGDRGGADASTDAESPFAALAAFRASLPEGPKPDTTVPGKDAPGAKPAKKGPAKAVVRLERKGRGGKDATVVEQLGLPAPELEAWCKALKSQLGCGGAIEGDTIVLQGDLRQRLPPMLEARGVRKVVV